MQRLGPGEETKKKRFDRDPVRLESEKRVFLGAGGEFPAKNVGSGDDAEAGDGGGQRREKEFREREYRSL
ncbi:hypothetical protein GmHk_10G030018 [Glycine max]|nr:hypothetical protein GmHk_10G030018 [Glycine max]